MKRILAILMSTWASASVGAQMPGVSAPQPCPSHTPDAQSPAARHGPPSFCGAVGGAVGGAAGSTGAGSVGVAVSVGAGSAGGGVAVVVERGPQPAIRIATISNSRIFMAASYTPRDE